MLGRVLCLLLCGVAATAAESLSGIQHVCLSGREHKVTYDVNYGNKDGSGSPQIYDVDTFTGLKSVECNIDSSSLKITWHDEIHSTAFWAKVKAFGAYLTGSSCPLPYDKIKQGFLLRRAVSSTLNGQALTIKTVAAAYDEIYQDAHIAYEPTGNDCAAKDGAQIKTGADQRICVGVNTDDSCSQAAAPIPVYSNSILSLTCSDCFVGLRADVFFSLKIEDWELKKMKAGFKQIDMQAKVQLDMQAQKQWSVGVDKTLSIMPHQTLINFKIGPVPFLVWFEAPLHITANAQLQASATASAGMFANYSIGDYYISWDQDNHWGHVSPTPVVSFTPTVTAPSAQFQGSADLTVSPSFVMHANQMFTYTMAFTPQLNMDVHGDTSSGTICESTTYDVALTSDAQLHLNIDWAHVHDDKEWGPTKIWGKQGNVSQVCTKV